jgi:hypothetical protein
MFEKYARSLFYCLLNFKLKLSCSVRLLTLVLWGRGMKMNMLLLNKDFMLDNI